ncbi:unnamed protein product [Periconia digitata]|uniref:Uncharacterized protein n=1 Tax=Periconia digitata TaxID=1303443 RepID=A0A9W4UFJ1_9PLEO|nr:unnamed protein product [Periconia digitata]
MVKFSLKPTADKRWQGVQRHYFTVFILKNIVLVAFIGLTIAESVLISKWYKEMWTHPQSTKLDGPVEFWTRIGIALIPDVIITFVAIFCMLTQKWHPITALCSTVVLSALWLFCAVINSLITYSGETIYFANMDYRDRWDAMCFAETGLQAAIAVMYMVMMGFAAKAVHVWRKGPRVLAYRDVEETS